ncbi:TonB family protein [Pedobacter ginsengisoli]|uniref:TonB family protein n=1 Tax=Pedobacter ginsengisoli TaxID=363852 RepID=UPI00254BE4B7|nr:TonB family protein [Pedobacter ginsengisoli]
MNWAHYILQVNIYLIVFYGFYKLLLAKETYFILNRIYLISAGILSLAIPFLRFEWFITQPVAQPVYIGVDQMSAFMSQVAIIQDAPDKISAGSILVTLYLLGVSVFIVKFIAQLYAVRQLLKRKDNGSAFSFFNRQVVDEQLPQSQTIQHHEEIHIRQLHSADVLFFEVLGILTWFNPIIYLYKTTIKNIHEYLADEEAARFQGDKEQYAMLLMSNALGVAPSTLINGFFNKSLLKKRIFMLYKERSRKVAILKYGLFVPLFAIALVASSATIRNNKNIKEIANEIPLGTPLEAVKEVVEQAITVPHTDPEQSSIKPQPKNASRETTGELISGTDWEPFYKFVMRTIRYPAAAQEIDLQGQTAIKFTVKNGTLEGLGTASKPLGYGLEPEVMRVIASYKDFAGGPDGNYIIPVSFRLSDTQSEQKAKKADVKLSGYTVLNEVVIRGYKRQEPVNKTETLLNEVVITTNADESGKIYDFVSLDAAPSFPGGMDQFYAYVLRSVKYPQEARNAGIQGKVFLSFIVETDGDLSDIKVERKLGGGTDEEAIRVLEESPKWVPGVQNGQRVRVKYNIPISFTFMPKQDVKEQLEGKAAGVQTNSQGVRIGVPGKNPPLYIIDGVRMKSSEPSALSTIKQDDIASIEVLKDETATKLYGAGGKYGVILITTKKGKTDKVYDFVSLETQPSFPGGMDKFYQYLGKAVRYPVEAQKNNIQGKVFLSFTVEKDGTLSDIKVERKLEPSLDAEAVRVVKTSPKWIPGKQEGKPVRVKYNLPISFSLSK